MVFADLSLMDDTMKIALDWQAKRCIERNIQKNTSILIAATSPVLSPAASAISTNHNPAVKPVGRALPQPPVSAESKVRPLPSKPSENKPAVSKAQTPQQTSSVGHKPAPYRFADYIPKSPAKPVAKSSASNENQRWKVK